MGKLRTFLFKCLTCGFRTERTSNTPAPCAKCGDTLRRDFNSFGIKKSFTPHFNHSVGKYVHSQAEFKSALSLASDKYSERTGLDASFAPVEAADRPGVTNEGMEETARRRRDVGIDQAKKKIIL